MAPLIVEQLSQLLAAPRTAQFRRTLLVVHCPNVELIAADRQHVGELPLAERVPLF
jgi:hypothetical protein